MSIRLLKKTIFIAVFTLFLLTGFCVKADTLNEVRLFNIESTYDISERGEVEATLVKISTQLYFYIESEWWNLLDDDHQAELMISMDSLVEEFEYTIYPTLTSIFGSEWRPGIDNDERITILLHEMKEEAGGYVNTGDEYPKLQFSESNEREMVYINAEHIGSDLMPSFLAHEFQHLISFNQKERIRGVTEETWLNEARSEYVPTLLGYDSDYEGSNLQRRVRNFLDKPSDSLTEWQGKAYDYGALNLFTQYLVDHYGTKILADSLKMEEIGIESLNKALAQSGFKEDFSEIFTNWTIATLINNCDYGEKYCYFNENLNNLRITPLTNFLPLVGDSTLSVTNNTKEWAGNWHKFLGGNGKLILDFSGISEIDFEVSYVVQDSDGNYSVYSLELDSDRKGTITVSEFGSKNTSLTIIPSIQLKLSGFLDAEPSYQFFWSASTSENNNHNFNHNNNQNQVEDDEIKLLLAQIEFLVKEIARLQALLVSLSNGGSNPSCPSFQNDLFLGMSNNSEVRCLQEFLRDQETGIYPEGLVTGNFLGLTVQAVIRFQEKYTEDVLAPWGLSKGTGYVGSTTIAKINEILSKSKVF